MKSIYYITLITRNPLTLVSLIGTLAMTGCGNVPITKTNCWSNTGITVTTSTKGASPVAPSTSIPGPTDLDATVCH
jgi:hypothetical protein